MNASECPICKTVQHGAVQGNGPWTVQCIRCKPFQIFGGQTPSLLAALTDHEQLALMQSLDETTDINPVIMEASLRTLGTTRLRSIQKRSELLLREIMRQRPRVGSMIEPFNPLNYELMRPALARGAQDLNFYLSYLKELEWLKYANTGHYTVTPRGWQQAEETGNLKDSRQAFVAMWFDKSMDAAWMKGFKPAIETLGWDALRIDNKEHINKICDEIILEIRRSRFLVADCTGQRGGVYYEAGFAQGLGIPVFLTCRDGDVLHFDVRQYNCIFWTDEADLHQKLLARLGAIVGPRDSR